MNILWQRIIRAAKLDSAVYQEVKKDTRALPQAIAVVVLSAVAAGIGSISKFGIAVIIVSPVIGLLAWYVWAFLIYFIGTKLLPQPQTQSNLGELLRTIGFSNAPGLIRIAAIFAGLERLIFSLAAAWMLVAMVIAVKVALGYKSTWRAVGVYLIGLIVLVALLAPLMIFFGPIKIGQIKP